MEIVSKYPVFHHYSFNTDISVTTNSPTKPIYMRGKMSQHFDIDPSFNLGAKKEMLATL